uniref:Uncharacterized protein n=1 Tax=Globodera pallida TaxID=36090 RepID=A0A183BZ31_GLOPA
MNVSFFICFFTLQLILINVAGGSDAAGEPKLRKKRNTDLNLLGFIKVHGHDEDRYDSDKNKRVNVDVRRNQDGDRHSNNQRDVNVDVQVPDVKVDVDREREGKRVHLKLLDKLKKYRSGESGEQRRVVKIEREKDGKRKTVYVGENRSD